MVVFCSCSLQASKLVAETTCCGSWFQIFMVLGKTEYRCAFTDDCGMRYFMLCPLVAITEAGMRKGVVGTATSRCMVAFACSLRCLSVSQSRSFSMEVTVLVLSVSLYKAGRTSFDHLNLVDVCACMGIPDTGSILQDQSYQRFVALFLYPWRTVPNVTSQEVEAVCCFFHSVINMLIPGDIWTDGNT